MTLLRAILNSKKIKLDERELLEFNKIYRLSYLLLLICSFIDFEFFEGLDSRSAIFAGYIGVITLIGSIRIMLKGLRISFRNLDLLLPSVVFMSINCITLLLLLTPLTISISSFLILLFVFIVIIFIILNVLYKYGKQKLEKELAD
ncbi:MAG: hypothetical protein WAO56_08785 [Miniphocaeibacter sp.]|uniref:hypothetical protein n=1 Tax=Miniphocaeibacter sp. TaxID=3100973 RepID=UPI0017FB889F|nr:hypothetical protein [Gallicola sp.]